MCSGNTEWPNNKTFLFLLSDGQLGILQEPLSQLAHLIPHLSALTKKPSCAGLVCSVVLVSWHLDSRDTIRLC